MSRDVNAATGRAAFFDGTGSDLVSTNVEDAIKEIESNNSVSAHSGFEEIKEDVVVKVKDCQQARTLSELTLCGELIICGHQIID